MGLALSAQAGRDPPAWPLRLVVAGVAGDLACLAAYALAGWAWLAAPAALFLAAWLLGLAALRHTQVQAMLQEAQERRRA